MTAAHGEHVGDGGSTGPFGGSAQAQPVQSRPSHQRSEVIRQGSAYQPGGGGVNEIT
ncbi:unannotated protein [freshwater metagenome]|uniref:Unannotated protein n=1 Tax=freshwater metagenome TaxID=449393 RepID=A0A6J7AI80_9ZZZZ